MPLQLEPLTLKDWPFTLQGIAYGQGTRLQLEVIYSEYDRTPAPTQLRSAWRARQDRRGVPLIVVGPNKVAYLDSAGSGNETARHTDNDSPTTIMVCSFEKENAGNVRLFGHSMAVPFEESSLSEKVLKYQATDLNLPQREVIEIDVAKTSTSCGCGVPVMEFVRERSSSHRGRRYKAS